MSQLFASGGQSIGASASAESSPTPQLKSINSLVLSLLYGPTLTSIYNYLKNHSLDYMDLGQHSLLFNMLPRLVIAFLPRSKCLVISWLQSPSAVILAPKKIKSVTVPIVSPYICHEVIGLDEQLFLWANYTL